jgi:hypothetical protein
MENRMKAKLFAALLIITFLGIWGFCIASGGIMGFMLGWMPAWVVVEIMDKLFK